MSFFDFRPVSPESLYYLEPRGIPHLVAVRGYRVTLRSLVSAVLVLAPITVAVRFLDMAFAGEPYLFNFMFLVSPPDISTPLDAFGHGWAYYFSFVGLALGVIVAAWVPWGIAEGLKRLNAARRRVFPREPAAELELPRRHH
jgi:hypothetical protein